MSEGKITFDRLVRKVAICLVILGVILLANHLSGVLLPFAIAWVLAYMLYPLVCFMQYRCRLHNRVLSIVAALAVVLGVLGLVLYLVIPPTVSELGKLMSMLGSLASEHLGNSPTLQNMIAAAQQFYDNNSVVDLIQMGQVQEALEMALTEIWTLVSRTVGFLIGVFSLFIIILYIFFILVDYENISEGWIKLVPEKRRPFLSQLVSDLEHGMNSYFRGQALIALIVGILFAVGFSIVGLPMGIGLGLFIGLLNLVPYLQVVGFLPTILCAVMKSMETGQNLWMILLWCLIVFAVVQAIQDFVLTPHIMGRAMGLKPAVILLSLSVWGALMGLLGLIVALPLTTLCLSYYKRYVLGQKESEEN